MDHSGARKTVALLQTKEFGPRHAAASAAPRQFASPYPPRCRQKSLKAGEVANDPVIPVVASQFLRELVVLLLDRKMVPGTPYSIIDVSWVPGRPYWVPGTSYSIIDVS